MSPRADPPVAVIRYRRPGRAPETFRQGIVQREPEGIVTFLAAAARSKPLVLGGRVVLENGSPIVWLTVPGACYDVGRFHTRDGEFTGYYTNILTPPEFAGPCEWSTTDLILDVWQAVDGAARLVDEDDFLEAVERGVLDESLARAARAEAGRILRAAGRGDWPPAPIREWTLARVRSVIGEGAGGPRPPPDREARAER
jgi:predicted RNA-binding protein associated with RNAse of E/G family